MLGRNNMKFLILVALLGLCLRVGNSAAAAGPEHDRPAASAAAWISKPKEDWPQIVLTNDVAFSGRRRWSGASAFLVVDEKAGVIAVTALHLLEENGKIEPAMTPREFDSALLRWRLHPRTLPDRFVEVAGLHAAPSVTDDIDWLALRLKPSEEPLPSIPLRLRADPVRVGETVHLVGVSYAEPEVRQKVYSGRVLERLFDDRFRFWISPAVNLRGFSGAPILDEKGLVVGVMGLAFKPRMTGERMLEAGGEDAASLIEILARLPNAPAEKSNPTPEPKP